MINRICKQCGKEFPVKDWATKKGWGKFCNRKCYSDYRKNPTNKWLSKEKNPNWKGGKVEKTCKICGKKFFIGAGEIRRGKKRGNYCSPECWYKNNKGNNHPRWGNKIRIRKICKTCHKEFFIYPSEDKKGNGKFCSHRCSGIWNVKHSKKKDTSIEIAIETELIKQNIPYLKQSPVEGIALVDFLLPDKIVIQCDGDFWHSTQEAKDRDTNQDFLLGFRGYKIYRFSGTEIRKSAKKCVKKMLRQATY